MRRQFLRHALGSAALQGTSKALMLLVSVLLAHLLGATGYGVYATVMAVVMVLSVVATLGLPILMVRMLPAYEVIGRPDRMRGLMIRGNQAVLACGLLLAAAGALAAFGFAPAHAAPAYWWAMALVPLLALGNLRSAMLRGLHHVVLAQVPECLLIPGLMLGALAIFGGIGGHGEALSPELAVGFRWAATLASFWAGAYLLLRHTPADVAAAAASYDSRTWGRSVAPSLLIAAMAVLATQIDVLMLAALRGSEEAGVYHAAARSAELVAFSMVVVNFAVQPMISTAYAGGDFGRLRRIVTLAARTSLALALPVALAFSVIAEPFLSRVFGADYSRGASTLAILCWAQVLSAAMGPVDHIMNMTGHERDTAIALVVGAGANVLLSGALIPFWDIEGAAVASGASLVLWRATLAMRVRARLGFWPSAFGSPGAHSLPAPRPA
jgi:O-antigen/teichoic acid export membrane protein